MVRTSNDKNYKAIWNNVQRSGGFVNFWSWADILFEDDNNFVITTAKEANFMSLNGYQIYIGREEFGNINFSFIYRKLFPSKIKPDLKNITSLMLESGIIDRIFHQHVTKFRRRNPIVDDLFLHEVNSLTVAPFVTLFYACTVMVLLSTTVLVVEIFLNKRFRDTPEV